MAVSLPDRTRSNEAKALGIAMGTPIFKVRDLVREHRIAVHSSNYTLYGDMSRRVMCTLEQFSPAVEIYSIDEAFVYLDGIAGDLVDLGQHIRQTVARHTGISVSVGIGPTKTLAKVANKLAKKDLFRDGVLLLGGKDAIDGALRDFSVGDVWGVGPRYGRMLKKHGITTAIALRDADLQWVRSKMTVMGLQTALELRSQRCFAAEMQPSPNQQIVRSRSFGKGVETLEDLSQAMAMHASRAAEKLRRQKLAASVMGVFIMTNRFRKDQKQYSSSVSLKLAIPSDATDTLIACALRGLRRIYKPGYVYKKAGVMLMDLSIAIGAPLSLFPELQQPQSSPLDKTLDAINDRYGARTLQYAAVGFEHPWKMKRQFCSPRYTTRWSELPIAKA